MESPADILNKTRDNRINIFFSNLDNNFDKFTDFYVSNMQFRMPKVSIIPLFRYSRYRIKYPVRLSDNTNYVVKFKNNLYDLYKNNSNYSYLECSNPDLISDNTLSSIQATVQFSFLFYMTYTLLQEIQNLGTTIKLYDYVFTGLTSKFNHLDGSLKFYITQTPVKNKTMDKDKFYLSITN